MTAVTEILTHCKKLISEGHQIDTQGLVHWIEDKLLDLEKEQIKNAWLIDGYTDITNDNWRTEFNEYYQETFKNTKK